MSIYIAGMEYPPRYDLEGDWTKTGYSKTVRARFGRRRFNTTYRTNPVMCSFEHDFSDLFKGAAKGKTVVLYFMNTDPSIEHMIEKYIQAVAAHKYNHLLKGYPYRFDGYTEVYQCTPVEMLRIAKKVIDTTEEMFEQNIIYKRKKKA